MHLNYHQESSIHLLEEKEKKKTIILLHLIKGVYTDDYPFWLQIVSRMFESDKPVMVKHRHVRK